MSEPGQTPIPSNPTVTAIRNDETSRAAALRGHMDRTVSSVIQEEGEELKEAAEQSSNVILDIDLDGKIRWVSPSWKELVWTNQESVQGKAIGDLLLDDHKDIFANALQALRRDDAGSKVVRFSVAGGKPSASLSDVQEATDGAVERAMPEDMEERMEMVCLEAQGILIYDRSTGAESHTMWMVRPSVQREITIDLPDILVESLGDGAEMLAHHLTRLADVGTQDPQHNPPPLPVLCRICERQITPWWFPKHTELCLQEHQADAELSLAQERLTEHRNAISAVIDALEAQMRHKQQLTATESAGTPPPQPQYKGSMIGATASPASGRSSPSSGSGSRERSTSGLSFSHHRARSFAVRRPLLRIVELIMDLCDTALEINQPSLKEIRGHEEDEIRTQSPQSEGRISQVLNWQSPSQGTLESEAGLATLCDDTADLARAKVDAVMLCRRIIEYAERIRTEYTSLVQDCIEAAMAKAASIAAGESSSGDSGDDEDTDRAEHSDAAEPLLARHGLGDTDVHQSIPTGVNASDSRRSSIYGLDLRRQVISPSFDGQSAMSIALKQAGTRSPSPQSGERKTSSTMSTRSNSPRPSKQTSQQTLQPPVSDHSASQLEPPPHLPEPESGLESDSSVRSAFRVPPRQNRSPSMEQTLSRVASSRERKRTSLILPDRSRSHTRQPSPARDPSQPVSPLRLSKPRLPSGAFDRPAITSPTFGGSEFCSPEIPARIPHHRRQSSAASSELSRAALSPRLSMTHPPPKAVAPSIKDFEIIKPISKGAFGSVYLAKKRSTGDYFAVKALKKQDMVAKNQVANVKAERAILMFQGESDFVAKLYWTFPSKDYIFLVMEYLNGGDCASLVRSLGTLSEDWAKRYIAEVVQGIDHLHRREIVHRDLKPDNLLVDHKGHLKLTDFGLSRMGLIGRQKRALNNKLAGSTLAPDPLKQGPFQRSPSMASSRSTSFDVQSPPSPGNTPTMTPVYHEAYAPSYFSLSKEGSGSRERHSSGQHSELGDPEEARLSSRRFSIYDHGWHESKRSSPKDVFHLPQDEVATSALSKSVSNTTQPKTTTPPPVTGAMLPPPMALFDPDDNNRRFVGTPDYLAPETINGLGQDEMSDWWSLGCIMFEFLYGYPPFHADSPELVFDNILKRRIDWPNDDDFEVSEEAKDLVNRLICLDPQTRLGANIDDRFESGGEEIKKHPWFADVDWETLYEAEASFVPAPENAEDTEYFDARGATAQDFNTEFDDQSTPPITTPNLDYERPHDALSKVRSQVNAGYNNKRGLMPLHIPPHVRDQKSRRQSEPAAADDFGQFSYKNLPVLNRSNQDVIQKLKAEAMQAQTRSLQTAPHQSTPQSAAAASPSPPSLEGSPMLGNMPLRRAISTSRGNHRSSSPSTLSHSNSSPSRQSQPSSPLVQFSTGNHERRKTSSSSSQGGHTQMLPSFFEIPRLNAEMGHPQVPSPVKSSRTSMSGDVLAHQLQIAQSTSGSPRTRSHTVGSSEGEGGTERRAPHHYKRMSQAIDLSPSSSDTEDPRQKALLRVHRRRQSARRMSQISVGDAPFFRPLDVLVIEDHPVSRLVIEKLMGKLRCRAIVAKDGAEAIRYAMGAVKFDIVMTEYRLPQINGADVARMLRETKNANSHTPVVCVTGYLKELQAPHHFDALIEKPADVNKLTEVMSRLCQWRAPDGGWTSQQAMSAYRPSLPTGGPPQSISGPPLPVSGLRKESVPIDESPTSTNSGYQASLPSISASASSRQDSISTASVWSSQSSEPRSEDATITAKRQGSEWTGMGGLGISSTSPPTIIIPPVLPSLQTEMSAPAAMETTSNSPSDGRLPRKSPSTEQIQAKRRQFAARERAYSGEAGDDEDEELGNMGRSRSRSPPKSPAKESDVPAVSMHPADESRRSSAGKTRKGRHASKLSMEMLRTNSQGNVISPGGSVKPLESPRFPQLPTGVAATSVDSVEEEQEEPHSEVTPPEIFPLQPGTHMAEFPMEDTPRPAHAPSMQPNDGTQMLEDRMGKLDLSSSSPTTILSAEPRTDTERTPKLSQSPNHND